MLRRVAWLLVLAWPTSAIALSFPPGGGSLFTFAETYELPDCTESSEYGAPIVPGGSGGSFGTDAFCSPTAFGRAEISSWTMTTDGLRFEFDLEAVGTYSSANLLAGMLLDITDPSDTILIDLESLASPSFGLDWIIEDLLTREDVARGPVDGSPIAGLPTGSYQLRISGGVLSLPTQTTESANGTALVSLIAVPEPSTAALLSAGLAVSGVRRRSQRASAGRRSA
jgi:hypothetical protein